MEVRLENTASATTNNDPAHCFVAIELSKSSFPTAAGLSSRRPLEALSAWVLSQFRGFSPNLDCTVSY
jgi:hypothetical protein